MIEDEKVVASRSSWSGWRTRLAVALCAALIALIGGLGPARADSDTSGPASCTPLEATQTYGVMPDGTATAAGARGSALVQEFAAKGGTTVGSMSYPDGFDPTTASDSTLRAFRLPTKPADPAALADWLSVYGHPLHSQPPAFPPCESNMVATITPGSSTNWSGRENTSSTGAFNHVVGTWTQPNFVFYCAHASMRSIWNGLGGVGRPLIQAGSSTISGSPGVNDVTAFIEVWPLENALSQASPPISTGDVINVDTSYTSATGGTATWIIQNATLGVTQGYYQVGVSGYYDGHTAEFIDERPTVNGNVALLRKSSNITYWSGEYVNGAQAANWPTVNVTMKDTDTLMTAVMGGTATSSETWKDCGPGSGTTQ